MFTHSRRPANLCRIVPAAVAIAALCLALSLAACSNGGASEGGSGNEGIANPWSDVETAEEAGEVAGFDFAADASPDTSFGEPVSVSYRAMSGMAEVTYEYGASKIIVRKGNATQDGSGDITGDYTEYETRWNQSVGSHGAMGNCYGNVEGTASKACWSLGSYDYGLVAQALGGEEDFGLDADDLSAFADAVQ